MKKKVKILRILRTLNPKYGGPSSATIDSSLALSKQNFKIDIATSDSKNSSFFKSKNIKIFNLGPAVGDFGFNIKLLFWLNKNKKKYDKFIIHGLWHFNTLLARLIIKKNYYVFTHGQLDPFFSTQFLKKIKKKIYWYFVERKNLLKAESILLTSENEKKSLTKTYVDTIGINKKVVDYGILYPKIDLNISKKLFFKKFSYLKNKEFFLYLGRFHQKKGCEILIKSIKKIIDKNINIKVLMVGPSNEYRKNLIKLSNSLNLKDTIFWSDHLSYNLKWGAILNSQAMLLSSHGENFGVSLVESLSMGRPVITTNKVNIYRYIENANAGLVARNNINSFSTEIEKFLLMKNKFKKKMRINSFKCFNKYFNLRYNQKKFISILKN